MPPSSRVTRFFQAFCFSRQPTPTLPVKVRNGKRSSVASRSPTAGSQFTTLNAPGGAPASCTISASVRASRGVWRAGFRTMLLPMARAGASLCATRFSGKLNGEIAAMGPRGTITVMAK